MKTKSEAAHAMGILLGLIDYTSLMKLTEDTLYEMYRNYIKNALAYNHLEDEVKTLRTEVMMLKARKR